MSFISAITFVCLIHPSNAGGAVMTPSNADFRYCDLPCNRSERADLYFVRKGGRTWANLLKLAAAEMSCTEYWSQMVCVQT
jgi:hypothetical protein